jgi:hypothetical protein
MKAISNGKVLVSLDIMLFITKAITKVTLIINITNCLLILSFSYYLFINTFYELLGIEMPSFLLHRKEQPLFSIGLNSGSPYLIFCSFL